MPARGVRLKTFSQNCFFVVHPRIVSPGFSASNLLHNSSTNGFSFISVERPSLTVSANCSLESCASGISREASTACGSTPAVLIAPLPSCATRRARARQRIAARAKSNICACSEIQAHLSVGRREHPRILLGPYLVKGATGRQFHEYENASPMRTWAHTLEILFLVGDPDVIYRGSAGRPRCCARDFPSYGKPTQRKRVQMMLLPVCAQGACSFAGSWCETAT